MDMLWFNDFIVIVLLIFVINKKWFFLELLKLFEKNVFIIFFE